MLVKNVIRASLKTVKTCQVQIASISSTASNLNRNRYAELAAKERFALPTRPFKHQYEELTDVVESTEEFKYVEKLIGSQIVPDPPKHDSYPTPSGWVPVNVELSSKLSYAVLRTRFHQFPMYAIEREGGSRKLVRIKNIEGDIWVIASNRIIFFEIFFK